MSVTGTVLKPMGIGRMLDYSFQLFRRHFVKLFLIMLIFLGPLYLLQQLIFPNLLSQDSLLIGNMINNIKSGTVDSAAFQQNMGYSAQDVLRIFGFVLIFLLYAITVLPIGVSTIIFYVQDVHAGRRPRPVRQLIKQAFTRFWPLVGSNLLYGLILTGILVAAVILVMIFSLIISFGTGFAAMNGTGSQVAAIIVGVVAGLGIALGVVFVMAYFGIRFMYYLPITALNEDSIGLGRSWKLTRKSFWRLFWTMLVIYLIIYFITAILSLIFAVLANLFLPVMLMQAILLLVNIVVYPLFAVTYAVSYFDLKVRSEGYGLEAMIQETIGTASEPAVHGMLLEEADVPAAGDTGETGDTDDKKED